MSKRIKKDEGIIKSIHIKATIFIIIYLLLSKLVFIRLVILKDFVLPLLTVTTFTVISGLVFLWFFSHEDFFRFIRDVEKKERKAEKKYEKKFIRYGKVTTTFLVAIIGGPLLAAITIRFLLHDYKHKYTLMILACVVATFFVWFLTKGAYSVFI